jgi:hypothetical protein
VLGAQSGTLAFPHAGGVVAITSALAGSLVLTTSAGAVTTIPATSVGVFPVASSGGAPLTSWALSNAAADVGKCTVALIVPGTFI